MPTLNDVRYLTFTRETKMFIRALLLILIISPIFKLQAHHYDGPYRFFVYEPFKRKEAKVYLPSDYDPKKSYPLVFSLHGDMSNPIFQNGFFPFHKMVTDKQFVLVVPYAKKDIKSIRAWNYGDFDDNYDDKVDDVYYISKLIDIVSATYTIDPKKIIMAGHSGGGFMTYKLACEIPNRISSIVSFAGAGFKNLDDCNKKEPVSTLQVHGTTDSFVPFEGTEDYSSALNSVKNQASFAKCDLENPEIKSGAIFHPRDKSTIYNYNNCKDKKNYQLWLTQDLGHVYISDLDFLERVLDWSFLQ